MTGPNAAGKGEVAAYFASLGYRVHSLSDVVREAAAEEGFPPEREHLIRIGTRLRREEGPGVLAERIASRLGTRCVVDSIRNPAEVAVLRSLPGFVLVGVRASEAVRFRRSVARGRPGDPSSIEEFRRREAQENTADPAAQRLDATLALADVLIDNDGDIAALRGAVREAIDRFETAGPWLGGAPVRR